MIYNLKEAGRVSHTKRTPTLPKSSTVNRTKNLGLTDVRSMHRPQKTSKDGYTL
ncbi:hypothetical protein [Halalkalibacter akibai]|uniref:hypothetical protein n=1 Tax=Halalkalibacter akibai TaxID=1411 RepID=UPI0012E0DE19|nr:hypothetical protein [Halalkalibacter akibai]